jgi:hypothetical protein
MRKIAERPYLVVFVLTVIFIFFLDKVIGIENSMLRAGIAASLAVILSPKKRKFKPNLEIKPKLLGFFLKPQYL